MTCKFILQLFFVRFTTFMKTTNMSCSSLITIKLQHHQVTKTSRTFSFRHPQNGVYLRSNRGGTVFVSCRVVQPQYPGLSLHPTEEGRGCPCRVGHLLVHTVSLEIYKNYPFQNTFINAGICIITVFLYTTCTLNLFNPNQI